jgi:hypothetical protein
MTLQMLTAFRLHEFQYDFGGVVQKSKREDYKRWKIMDGCHKPEGGENHLLFAVLSLLLF